jgi:hypothetical protein
MQVVKPSVSATVPHETAFTGLVDVTEHTNLANPVETVFARLERKTRRVEPTGSLSVRGVSFGRLAKAKPA